MIKNITYPFLFLLILVGCAPDFLDVKPSKSLVVPNRIEDFQALLDGVSVGMNQGPGLHSVATDEFFHPESNLPNLPFVPRNSYLWARDIFEGQGSWDWEVPYKAIFKANIALDGLTKIHRDAGNETAWDQAYAGALFHRAFSLFSLVEVFAAPYDEASASTLPGIPVRLTMNINEIVGRGTLQQTYDQIIKDLTEAEKLLPGISTYLNRPSKAAVYAALARMYLGMRQYDKAGTAASEALKYNGALLDYNTLDADAARPFPHPYTKANPEIIFDYALTAYGILTNSQLTGINMEVYNAYDSDDLRKSCFFISRGDGVYGFKGSYRGTVDLCGTLATDELYLIRAEANARQGNTKQALVDLNRLLEARFKTGTFKELTAKDEDILDVVLMERRKELYGRGIRWSDLRRLNKEPGRAVTLRRTVGDIEHVLEPNSNRYVFPIPNNEINLSGIEQNPR